MKAFLNWSGGKDSAYCLHHARAQGLPVEALVTTLDAQDRVSMHGVRRTLLERQAASVGLPLHTITLPEAGGTAGYEAAIRHGSRALRAEGFTHAVSGDLFLEDLRTYRETLYAKDGIKCLFPLWKMDTEQLLPDFIARGFRALIVCVDSRRLPRSFCGRLLDADISGSLPPGVDPCGENGEYHSFVFDGPGFSRPVDFVRGDTFYREYPAPKTPGGLAGPQPPAGFYHCDLLHA